MKYKVILLKIFALIASVALVISVFAAFSVSADDESEMTNQEYYAAQSYLIAKYKDGKISYSEFQQQSQAVTDEFVSKNTVGGVLQSGALNASNNFNAVSQKIGDTVQKYGDSARDYISSFVSGFMNNYTVTNTEPTFDMQGNGCVLVVPFSNAGNGKIDRYRVIYGEYGLIKKVGDEIHYFVYNVPKRDIYDLNWNFKYSQSGTSVNSGSLSSGMKRYGDWRFENGEPADTDDEFQTITDYDFSEAPERELEDLLKKILNEFELQQPDLSSIEGLLNAIYARLGTLDSDNDNTLLSQILTAIKALDKIGNSSEKTELEKILEDLKNSLVYDDGENIETISEQLKRIIDNQFTIDDFTIDESEYNQRSEILKLRLLGKFSFIHNLSEFVSYIFDSYKNTSDNPEISFEYNGNTYSINFSCYDYILPLAQCLIAAFIYITYAYHTYRKVPSYINGGDNE